MSCESDERGDGVGAPPCGTPPKLDVRGGTPPYCGMRRGASGGAPPYCWVRGGAPPCWPRGNGVSPGGAARGALRQLTRAFVAAPALSDCCAHILARSVSDRGGAEASTVRGCVKADRVMAATAFSFARATAASATNSPRCPSSGPASCCNDRKRPR